MASPHVSGILASFLSLRREFIGYPDRLKATVSQLLAEVQTAADSRPKAVIAPHAGYVYSGPVAAEAFALLRAEHQHAGRVVITGPAHRVWFRGIAVPSARAFVTPFGNIPLDTAAISEIADDTLLVVSSDLSHYLRYEDARRRDCATAEAIERLDETAIDFEDACGALPVRGLLIEAKRRGLSIERLDLRNSGDTAGDRNRVVGYGAWAIRAE